MVFSKMKMNLYKGTTTYYPVLIPLVQKTTGAVLELGTGISSTPLLHWLCLGRKLYSYESNKDYYQEAKKYVSGNHRVIFTEDYKDVRILPYDVVLVDHSPKDRIRANDVFRIIDSRFIVLHDSENPRNGYEQLYPHFKYRYDWKLTEPYTTVLSNTEIEKWI